MINSILIIYVAKYRSLIKSALSNLGLNVVLSWLGVPLLVVLATPYSLLLSLLLAVTLPFNLIVVSARRHGYLSPREVVVLLRYSWFGRRERPRVFGYEDLLSLSRDALDPGFTVEFCR